MIEALPGNLRSERSRRRNSGQGRAEAGGGAPYCGRGVNIIPTYRHAPEYLSRLAGIELQGVPYRAIGNAVTD